MTLGIVVDDTVHYLSKYLRGIREEKLSPEEATRYAFKNVGFALSTTTIALVAGFPLQFYRYLVLKLIQIWPYLQP